MASRTCRERQGLGTLHLFAERRREARSCLLSRLEQLVLFAFPRHTRWLPGGHNGSPRRLLNQGKGGGILTNSFQFIGVPKAIRTPVIAVKRAVS